MPDDVNEEFSIFHEKVSKCVRNHVPLIKLGRKKISLHSKPWISVRTEQMMVKKDKYLRKFNRTISLDMEYLYKKFRNKVVSEIRKSKNDYYFQYSTKHKTNMKLLWSGIRSIVNFKSDVSSSISSLTHDGFKVDEQKTWLTYFMKYLQILHKKSMRKFQEQESHLKIINHLKMLNLSLSFFIFTPHEIKVIINSMKSGKAV